MKELSYKCLKTKHSEKYVDVRRMKWARKLEQCVNEELRDFSWYWGRPIVRLLRWTDTIVPMGGVRLILTTLSLSKLHNVQW
jgi:hypothetical protein